MWKIMNVSMDRRFTEARRKAPGLIMEPLIGSIRLRMGKSMEVTDAHFQSIKPQLDGWKTKGVVDYENLEAKNPPVRRLNKHGEDLDGPTLEDWVKSGYIASNYPPAGYAIKDSPGWFAELERRTAPKKSSLEVDVKFDFAPSPEAVPTQASDAELDKSLPLSPKRGPGRPKKEI